MLFAVTQWCIVKVLLMILAVTQCLCSCSVECLEGQFDTWGAFGHGFLGDLAKGGPTPLGAQKANLSAANLPYMQEVALNEQVWVLCLHPQHLSEAF